MSDVEPGMQAGQICPRVSLLEEEHRSWVAVAPPPWQEEVSWGPTPCQLSALALSSPPC